MPRSLRPANIALVLVLALAASAPAAAQSYRPQGGVAWGRALPVGDYHAMANGQGFGSASQGMALVALQKRGSAFGIRLDAVYTKNPGNDSLNAALTTALGQATTEQVKLLGANLDLTYALRSGRGPRPYVLAGLGLYHVTIAVTSGGSTANDAATKPAWNLGAGMSYAFGPIAPFFEARYVAVSALSGYPRTTFIPFVLGVRFSGR
jgi:opacity protein-like surface antigen